MLKVAKFGGSSLANAEQFRKVKKVVESDPSRKYIVASACGKEGKEDHKVTDLLYLCHAHLKYGVEYESILGMIIDKYQRICSELGLSIDIDKEFDDIRSQMHKNMDVDYLVSRGEYLTSKCLSEYLGAEFLDASKVIAFNYEGTVDLEKTAELIRSHADPNGVTVIPGFYGFMPDGTIKVMTRGGSDITGSIVANVIGADVYENWTDVSGFMVTDPSIIRNPKQIKRITYAELREMSYMGANVLHDETVFPVRSKNIPINIRNTNDIENPGTLIMDSCEEADRIEPPGLITGITGKKHFVAITITKGHASSEVGVLKKALQIFEDHRISIENIPISVDSATFIVKEDFIRDSIYEIISELKKKLEVDDVQVSSDLSLVAIVGRGMISSAGTSGKIFGELGKNGINIRMINQGSDEISIIVGVETADFEKTIRCIYDRFIEGEKE